MPRQEAAHYQEDVNKNKKLSQPASPHGKDGSTVLAYQPTKIHSIPEKSSKNQEAAQTRSCPDRPLLRERTACSPSRPQHLYTVPEVKDDDEPRPALWFLSPKVHPYVNSRTIFNTYLSILSTQLIRYLFE